MYPFKNHILKIGMVLFLSFWLDMNSISQIREVLNGGFKEVMILKALVIIGIVVLCIPGCVMAIINAIRADPPFTIMEKKKDTENEDKD